MNIYLDNDTDISKIDIKTKIIFVLVVLVVLINHIRFDNTVLKNVDMEPFSEPVQQEIKNGKTFEHEVSGGVAEITPIADYKIYGRVYDIHYRPSKMWAAAVYPYDVSIGFGDFKFKEVYKSVKVRMAGTVSYYSYSGSAWQNHLSKYFKHEGGINHAFTNNHLCPANKNVRKGIKKLRKKDIVYLEGYLIKYKFRGNDGRMEEGISSTVRNDKESFRGNNGSGSCEQFYVTRVVSRHGDFR